VPSLNASDPCPCGSHKKSSLCCKPFLSHRTCAPTAEALMRSRYCAFYSADVAYLMATLHPSKRSPDDRHNLELSCAQYQWFNLEICAVQKGQSGDDKGTVEFVARYIANGQPGQIHERSRFVRQDNRWYYLDGQFPGSNAQGGSNPGRNEPCWCGSSRKYKKCHGATRA